MFEKITPEKAGVRSSSVKRLLRYLEKNGIVMHSLLLMKGEALFGEYYWKPFDADFCHRMYSQTKSYVSIAIGLLEEDGKLELDAPIASYFPEKTDRKLPEYLEKQTVRDMLTMCTACHSPYWFSTSDPDRTHEYLTSSTVIRPSGTIWEYDSPGSQVLSSLVEKLSGKTLFDYLYDKIFCHLGTFSTASILKTRNGDSWGDSALLCTPRDMISFARFVMNYGDWHGKRLMNENYLRLATTKQADNHRSPFGKHSEQGYGYQIWCTKNGFAFNGMGGQFTICVPELDTIFVCTGDNQGYDGFASLVFAAFDEFIVSEMSTSPLPENENDYKELCEYASTLTLAVADGKRSSEFEKELNGKLFICNQNKAGFERFSFSFDGNGKGVLRYVNAQGEKELHFGMTENVFTKFPQLGYSDDRGGVVTDNGFTYDCAVSAGWLEEKKLLVRVQVIDRYFGNLGMMFAFKENEATVLMVKTAENFFNEYQGEFTARAE